MTFLFVYNRGRKRGEAYEETGKAAGRNRAYGMKYDIRKRFRITEKQQKHLSNRCGEYGITEAEFLRRLLNADMGREGNWETKEEMLLRKQLIYEVNRIGSNINQIVKNANMHYYTEYEKKKLFAMMAKLIDLMGLEGGKKSGRCRDKNGSNGGGA